MELKTFKIPLSLEYLKKDPEAYERDFFTTLSEIKNQLARVEQNLMPYHELNSEEFNHAETFYNEQIDHLNSLDMSIRVEFQKLTRT